MTRPLAPEAAPDHANDGRRRPATTRDPDLPEGVVTLADALHELVSILPGLKIALQRAAEPPVAYRKREAARMLGISQRLLERLLAAGKFAKADAYASRCPLWTRATLERWVQNGGGR
jgi:hypothetical protein